MKTNWHVIAKNEKPEDKQQSTKHRRKLKTDQHETFQKSQENVT